MNHFLSVRDLPRQDVPRLFALIADLKGRQKARDRMTPLAGRTMALIFEKPSLRTRVTFEVAMVQLGGAAVYLAAQEIGLGERESIPDIARNLSRWVDVVAARVFIHDTVEQLAAHASVPVINGLSDLEHPCQALADFFTLWERGLDLAEIARALDDGSARRAFEEDLAECRREGVTGFPTFVLHGARSSVRIEGYRPWEEFEEVLQGIAPVPTLGRPSAKDTLRAFLGRYGRCATREIAAVLGESDDETELLLDEMAADGGLVRREIGGGLFWEPVPVVRGEVRPAGPSEKAEASR